LSKSPKTPATYDDGGMGPATGLPFLFTDLPEVTRLLGPAFARWRVTDPTNNLVAAITALTAGAIEDGRANMAGIQIPSWDEEAVSMMAVYSTLMSHSGRKAGSVTPRRAQHHGLEDLQPR
jgi:hypothetical protein